MTPPDQLQEEPLKNADLEGKMIGLRMALTPEEGAEARAKFLEALRVSPLAVPTVAPVPTAPDGSLLPNAQINLLIATTAEGVSGVPAFTTLGQLRATLPQVENGMFLNGGDLGNILGSSGHKLFVDSLDAHVEVEPAELQQMAFVTHQQVQIAQQAAEHNQPLEDALQILDQQDAESAHGQIVAAFLNGFCRYPLAGDKDEDAECLVLAQENPDLNAPASEMPLLTQDGALIAFTSEESMRAWDTENRTAVSLPGQMIVPLATQAEVHKIVLNPKSPSECILQVTDGQVSVT